MERGHVTTGRQSSDAALACVSRQNKRGEPLASPVTNGTFRDGRCVTEAGSFDLGRKPIGERAMTPAERQARRRKRLCEERAVETKRSKRLTDKKVLAAYVDQLEDNEVQSLIRRRHRVARQRGIEVDDKS